jgi:hypothetical protein
MHIALLSCSEGTEETWIAANQMNVGAGWDCSRQCALTSAREKLLISCSSSANVRTFGMMLDAEN